VRRWPRARQHRRVAVRCQGATPLCGGSSHPAPPAQHTKSGSMGVAEQCVALRLGRSGSATRAQQWPGLRGTTATSTKETPGALASAVVLVRHVGPPWASLVLGAIPCGSCRPPAPLSNLGRASPGSMQRRPVHPGLARAGRPHLPACSLSCAASVYPAARGALLRSQAQRLPLSSGQAARFRGLPLQAPGPRGQGLKCSSSEACCAAHGAPSGQS